MWFDLPVKDCVILTNHKIIQLILLPGMTPETNKIYEKKKTKNQKANRKKTYFLTETKKNVRSNNF